MREITECRACGSTDLDPVLSLGEQRISDFREDDSVPPSYPLELVWCRKCTLAQLKHSAPPSELYHGNYSFKSGISEAIGRDLANVAQCAQQHHDAIGSWLDIACNDGTLLSNVPKHIDRVGVDPLVQFAREAWTHANHIVSDFFIPDYFTGTDGYETFDIITSISMFYDLDDPNKFVSDVVKVLDPDGLWIIQQNYLPAMITNRSVDNISHEHLTYFALSSLMPLLERHGLEVIDVELNPINGGCFRTLVAHKGKQPVRLSVEHQLQWEREEFEIGNPAVYAEFARQAENAIDAVRLFVLDTTNEGKSVYVYGASTRGAVIWQAARLTSKELPYVVERNPDKVGRYMSAIGSPIISEEEMRANPPDVLLVGPWWLRDDFVKRESEYLAGGGALAFPLPRFEVVRS